MTVSLDTLASSLAHVPNKSLGFKLPQSTLCCKIVWFIIIHFCIAIIINILILIIIIHLADNYSTSNLSQIRKKAPLKTVHFQLKRLLGMWKNRKGSEHVRTHTHTPFDCMWCVGSQLTHNNSQGDEKPWKEHTLCLWPAFQVLSWPCYIQSAFFSHASPLQTYAVVCSLAQNIKLNTYIQECPLLF